MRFLIFPILLSLFAPTIGRAASISISAEVQIEPVSSFTTFELWNATTPISTEFGVIVVNHRTIDSETQIIREKWAECGFVLIGTGDIATHPVAFRIWTRQACNLSIKKAENSVRSGEINFTLLVNSTNSLPIQVSSELVVTVAGKRIGRIRSDGEKR